MITKGTVLVIEDDAAIRELLAMALELEEYRVICAANGLEGLRQATNIHCDVIVVDANMPVLDGKAFVEAYQRTPLPHAPILAASVRYTELQKLQDMSGIVGCVRKPYDLPHMLHHIEQVVKPSAAAV